MPSMRAHVHNGYPSHFSIARVLKPINILALTVYQRMIIFKLWKIIKILYLKNIIKKFLSLQKDHVKVPLHALFNASIIAKLTMFLVLQLWEYTLTFLYSGLFLKSGLYTMKVLKVKHYSPKFWINWDLYRGRSSENTQGSCPLAAHCTEPLWAAMGEFIHY